MCHHAFNHTQVAYCDYLLSGNWHTQTKYLICVCIHALVQWPDDEPYLRWKQVSR